MKWNGEMCVDKVLLFGLRSASKIYNAVADALLWILTRWDYVYGIHYLDDFLLFGESRSSQRAEGLCEALARCEALGVPVAPGETEGPSTKMVFLGIQIETHDIMSASS